MAECVLAKEASGLPLAIVRPTMVTGMWKDDPIRGWVESTAHISGLIITVSVMNKGAKRIGT